MSAIAIWVDTHEAKIFKFTANGVKSEHLKHHGGGHPHKSPTEAEKFFHELAQHMSKDSGTEWLLLGPGLAKDHFKKHIEQHHSAMAKKIVGLEGTDHLTDAQIQDHARKFFRHRGVFEGL